MQDRNRDVIHWIKQTLGEPVQTADVYAMGVGAEGKLHLTLEAILALARSKAVFGFDDVAFMCPVLEEFGTAFIRLEYGQVEKRSEIFRRAADLIARHALSEPPVVWLTVGNPIRHVWLSHILRMWAEQEGLAFRSVLAPSFLDKIIDALKIDDTFGLQLYDATALLFSEQRLNPFAHCFIFNPQKTSTERSCYGGSPRKAMLTPLRNFLAKTYGQNHQISFVTISGSGEAKRRDVAIADIPSLAYTELGTLWVPPIDAPLLPRAKVAELYSVQHLVRVAHTACDGRLSKMASSLAERIRSST